MTMTMERSPSAPVWEPWTPREGDWVRVDRSPECRAFHSQRGEPARAYGRVESVDRYFDDPAAWLGIVEETRDGVPDYDEAEALQDARNHRGHFYYVSDVHAGRLVDLVDGVQQTTKRGPVTFIDGNYCALELTPVSRREAIRAIAAARRAERSVPPDVRLWRALKGAAS